MKMNHNQQNDSGRPINALIMDDERHIRVLLQDYLEAVGFECRLAESVSAAKKLLQEAPADIVLTDINLPEDSGIVLIEHVKKGYPQTAVVVVSVIDNPEEARAILDLDVNGYIVKPFERSQVLICVDNAIRRMKLEKRDACYRESLEKEIAEKTATINDQLLFLQTLMDAIPIPIYFKDMEGKYQGCNQAFEGFIGHSKKEIVGKKVDEIVPPSMAIPLSGADRDFSCGSGQRVHGARIPCSDGDMREVLFHTAEYKDTGGMFCGIVGGILDITERVLMEKDLRQAHKMEAIGQLAAGIAHEINTPIQYVGDNVAFLKDSFKDLQLLIDAYKDSFTGKEPAENQAGLPERIDNLVKEIDIEYLWKEIPSAVEQIKEGLHRVSKIVTSMKAFSHPGTEEKTLVDIHKSIETAVTIAKNEWKYVADLKMDFDNALPPLPCLPDEMNQVFLNLIVNAAHAVAEKFDPDVDGKGRITICTKMNKSHALIEIQDNGIGIPELNRHKIFNPFFTTKPVGKGTGQGLAIAYNIITEKHHGKIHFESEEGHGTTFVIELPKGEK